MRPGGGPTDKMEVDFQESKQRGYAASGQEARNVQRFQAARADFAEDDEARGRGDRASSVVDEGNMQRDVRAAARAHARRLRERAEAAARGRSASRRQRQTVRLASNDFVSKLKMASDKTGAEMAKYIMNRNEGDADHDTSWHCTMYYLDCAAEGDGAMHKAAMQSAAEMLWAALTIDERGGQINRSDRAASAMRSDARGRRQLGRGEGQHASMAGFIREQRPPPSLPRAAGRRTYVHDAFDLQMDGAGQSGVGSGAGSFPKPLGAARPERSLGGHMAIRKRDAEAERALDAFSVATSGTSDRPELAKAFVTISDDELQLLLCAVMAAKPGDKPPAELCQFLRMSSQQGAKVSKTALQSDGSLVTKGTMFFRWISDIRT